MAWQGRATAPRPPPPRLARSTRCPPHHTIALLPRRRAPVASPPCRRVPAALHSPVASPHSFSCCAPGRTRPSQRCGRVPVIPPPPLFRVAPSPVFLPRLERRSQKMFHVKHLFTCRMTLQQVFHVKHSLLFVRLAPARPQYAPVLPSSLPPQRFPICSRLALRLAHNSLPSPLPPRPQRFPIRSQLAWGSARGVFRWNEVFPRAFSLE